MKIYFVREKGTSECSIVSQNAFKIFVKNKLHPVHISENEASNVSIQDDAIFVLEDLDSPFAIQLADQNARIISPYVVLYLTHESSIFDTIPKRSHKLTSQCLRSMVITSTGFSDEDEKESLIKKIRSMSGLYQPQLDSNVTVLIAKNVFSEKYRVASTLGIPVVTKDWIVQCWHKYQYEIKPGFDMLSKHLTPLFYQLQFCVSGITLDERALVEKLVRSNGGKYSGVMNRSTNILLSNGVVSPKTKLAEKMNIAVLSIHWLHDSIEAKYALHFDKYRISATVRDDRYDMMLAEDENKVSDIKPVQVFDSTTVTLHPPITEFDASDQSSAVKQFEYFCTRIDETFLDDHTIYAIGFSSQLLRAIKRACTLAGAVFLNSQLDTSPTQIIVGPKIGEINLEAYVIDFLKNSKDKILSIDWLIDSLKSSSICETKSYIHNPFEAAGKRVARLVSENSDKENNRHKIRKNNDDFDIKKTSNKHDFLSSISMNEPKSSTYQQKNCSEESFKYVVFSGFENLNKLPNRISSSLEILESIPEDKTKALQTCLILKELNTSEKVLAAIAAGIYILKPSFLHASKFSKDIAFEHEWAEEMKDSTTSITSDTTRSILSSTRLSREAFHKTKKRLFDNVSVLIMNHTLELDSVSIILKAGGATIYTANQENFRFAIRNDVTLVLFDVTQNDNNDEDFYVTYCLKKYFQSERLFQPKFITHFICGLDSSSFDFFDRFIDNASTLPEFYKRFAISNVDIEHIK